MTLKDKKPKGAKSAYICFTQFFRQEQNQLNSDTKIGFAEMSKTCSEKWKTMSVDDKQKFVDMAAQDKDRFNQAMEDYQQPPDLKSKSNKRKAKDPNMPKRPWSAFFFFCDEHRNAVKLANAEFKVGDVAKVMGKMWSECTDKSKYEELSKEAKVKYNKAMEEYKNGSPESKKAKETSVSNEESEELEDELSQEN